MDKKSFLGFGFGAIQAGLFLREAANTGNFKRMVIAEIQPEIVASIRSENGKFRINTAYQDHIEQEEIGLVEIYNPNIPEERENIIRAAGEADEISTAIPSVAFYTSESAGSIDRTIAEAIRIKKKNAGPSCVIYTAENHNRAAEILKDHVWNLLDEPDRKWAEDHVQFLNTVIGKMSQVVTDPVEIEEKDLTTVTEDSDRAFLVESFNQILISEINLPASFQRGIQVFEEKGDLLPFEEAKLFGHNAAHALIGYTGLALGLQFVRDIAKVPGFVTFIRAAFIEESGGSLTQKYRGRDLLFTEDGWRDYTNDLIGRMMNPFLGDRIERVIRDPERKLGWNDRLVGTMRLTFSQALNPIRYAFGAAAALDYLRQREKLMELESTSEVLLKIWGDYPRNREEEKQVIQSIESARDKYKHWLASGQPNLSDFFKNS